MELEFIFRDTAFKHGLTETDIRHVFDTCCYLEPYSNRDNVFLLLGFDMNANPIEILYNEYGSNIVNVFHVMPCRKQFYYLFKRGNL